MNPTIYIVIPVYNEEQRIKKVLSEVLPFVDKVVIVDDGSTDSTNQNIKIQISNIKQNRKNNNQKSEKIILLRHRLNLGQGAALETGFEYCRKQKADIIVTYDADGQFVAQEIKNVVQPIIAKKAEVVLGSRFLGKTVNMPFIRKIFLKMGIVFTNVISGIKVNDTHNGFRAFSLSALKKIHLKQARMAHASEIIDLIATHRLKFCEVPVTIIYDEYTKKKGQSLWNSFNIIIDIILQKLE